MFTRKYIIKVRHVIQLVECLPSRCKTLRSIPQHPINWM